MKKLFHILLCIILFNAANAISPPEFRCVAVDNGGNTTLTWIPPADVAPGFKNYQIYYSANLNGPYNLLETIANYSQTSTVHNGANANIQSVYYYIRSQATDDTYSEDSDTLQSIFLNITDLGNGYATLDWNAIHTPNLLTSNGWYMIYKETTPGNWVKIDSTTNLQYTYTLLQCNEVVKFRIEISDADGCSSVSSAKGGQLKDVTGPGVPLLNTISVDSTTGKVVIDWGACPDNDTEGYIIFQYIGGIWVPVDTVYGQSSTSYIDNNSAPGSSSLSYRIAAFDTCSNMSTMSNIHKTIYLQGAIDICQSQITLNWSSYISMTPSLEGYNIYYKENNGAWSLLAAKSSSETSHTYTYSNIGSDMCFAVQAYGDSGNKTSLSNVICIRTLTYAKPDFAYLRYATVNDGHVDLNCYVDSTASISQCNIMRADSINGVFAIIETLYGLPASSTILSSDYTASTGEKSYCYKMVIYDSCGSEILTTNIAKTILLSVETGNDFNNTLTWNDYQEWPGTVNSYNIYRKTDAVSPAVLVSNVLSGSNSYIDDVSNYTSTEGEITYSVEAVENSGNPYGFNDVSMSNEVLSLELPKFFVPNAFAPNGVNKIFKPIGVFIDHSDYKFVICNRYGWKVFETTNIEEGWDGVYKGKITVGVYAYYIKYKTSAEVYIEKKGTVTLIN